MARLGDLTSAGPEFCELIDIPRVIDLLKVIIHHELRLENTYGYIRRKGFAGLRMHGGGSFDSNGQDMTLMYSPLQWPHLQRPHRRGLQPHRRQRRGRRFRLRPRQPQGQLPRFPRR